MSEVKKTKSKHIVLDPEGEVLFMEAVKKSGASTQKEATRQILQKFINDGELNELKNLTPDLTDYHNPADLAEIERLRKLMCDEINCELNAELTRVNSELNAVNKELNDDLTELTRELTQVKSELTASVNRVKKGGMSEVFTKYEILILRWMSVKIGGDSPVMEARLLHVLRRIFLDYMDYDLNSLPRPNKKALELLFQKSQDVHEKTQ